MDTGIDSLVGLYLAGLSGLGYGVRQILDAQRAQGIATDTIVISGGAGQSPLVRQILAAVAAGHHRDTGAAMSAMSELGDVRQPDPAVAAWHTRRFAAFQKLQAVGRDVGR